MTPAIKLAQKQGIIHKVHEYKHDSKAESYGLEAAEKLNLDAAQVFKTLVLKIDDERLCVAILPVQCMLSMKLLAKAAGAKKANMAEPLEVQRTTGYVLGGVSPLAQKKRLQTIIDSSAKSFTSMYVSGGKRGLEIELAPQDLAKLCNASFFNISA